MKISVDFDKKKETYFYEKKRIIGCVQGIFVIVIVTKFYITTFFFTKQRF